MALKETEKKILTSQGLKNLEAELDELRTVKRKEIAQKIKEAREQGDLSENAEYDAAKEEQREIEARIEELEELLKNVEVVDEDEIDLDTVNIGCEVKLQNVDTGKQVVFKLVGSTEANALKGKISNESPVGRELIGAKKGSKIKIEAPAGIITYKIMSIHKAAN